MTGLLVLSAILSVPFVLARLSEGSERDAWNTAYNETFGG